MRTMGTKMKYGGVVGRGDTVLVRKPKEHYGGHHRTRFAAYDARTGSSNDFCEQHGVASSSVH